MCLTCEDNTPCSAHFIRAIIDDVSFALDKLVDESDTRDPRTRKAVKTICDNIFSEVKRLQEHPDLFPSERIKEAFEHWIDCECEIFDTAVTTHEERSKDLSSYIEGREKVNEQSHTPFFKPNLKPWHQFLHNGSPGLTTKSFKPKEGSRQIVPPGAVHLLGVWRCENKAFMKKRKVVRSPTIHLTAT